MRAAIYARYSSDLQREASIEDQVRLCRRKLAQEGWSEAEVFCDQAISGGSILRRGYQALLEGAQERRFEIVVAEALDRLSRDLSDIALLYKQLTFAGIRLVTLTEGEISDLHVGLKGTMNAIFLKDLADKTRRGLEGRVRQGRSGGGNAYGYDVVGSYNENGEPERGLRSINPAEAAIVERIFFEFGAGRSPIAIAKALNQEGIPGPRGKAWRDSTIRGHQTRGTGILNNELYVGRLIWNRQRYVKDPVTGKRVSRPNPPKQWIAERVPDLRIVSDELWDAAKDRQAQIRNSEKVTKARATRFWEHRRPQHLLTGKVLCGNCGAALSSVGRDYLGCGAARKQGTCDNRRSIRRETVEAEVLQLLQHKLMEPIHVEAFIAAFNAEMTLASKRQQQERDARDRDLAALTRKLEGLYDAIADGLRSPGLQTKLEELEKNKDELEAIMCSKTPDANLRLHPKLSEIYRSKVANLGGSLREPTVRDEAIPLVRELIDTIIVTPDGPHRRDGWTIELSGDIVRMIAFGNEPRAGYDKAALEDRAACSVKVVAGEGFVQARTELELRIEV